MNKYLEVGKYYNFMFENFVVEGKNLGSGKIPFRVKSIKVALIEDEEYEPQDVASDKLFRKKDGSLDYDKYEFEHYIETSFGVDDERELTDGNFMVIENQDEIEKAKASIELEVDVDATEEEISKEAIELILENIEYGWREQDAEQ